MVDTGFSVKGDVEVISVMGVRVAGSDATLLVDFWFSSTCEVVLNSVVTAGPVSKVVIKFCVKGNVEVLSVMDANVVG